MIRISVDFPEPGSTRTTARREAGRVHPAVLVAIAAVGVVLIALFP